MHSEFDQQHDRTVREEIEVFRRKAEEFLAGKIPEDEFRPFRVKHGIYGQRPTKRRSFTWDQLYGMGLHRLMGTVKYPSQATPRRSSLSRVPENGTHGLKGEIRNGLA